MVVALSRFKVANGMEAEVARAFRQRPRSVEKAPGFLWLEVMTDRSDPAVFYLLTRWTDQSSFESWHKSAEHRESHAFIPKGLKLDASWTHLYSLDRIDGVTGSPLTDTIADATLLISSYASQSNAVYLFSLERDGRVRAASHAAQEHLVLGPDPADKLLLDYMPAADAARLSSMLQQTGRRDAPVRLNFAPLQGVPFTLECWLDVHEDRATLLGHPTFRREQQLQDELMAINQELAALSRTRSREARDERSGREAAEQVNRERNAFMSILSHELRQPIGSALAAMSILRKVNPDPALEAPRVVLERQLRQITRLVEDLTDTARVASGNVELQRAEIDIARQLRELATAWEAQAIEQKKSFTARLPDFPVMFSGDAERLQQVFSNLVGNAFKYTPAGGAIGLSMDVHDRVATVVITDEGEGIAPDRLPRVFDLFQRETKTGSGLGVGLAIVRALVEAHGGTIVAKSDGIGRGATFTVRLPMSPVRP
jgi:signal transduction histidine kinase/heme-degrading monooxygenase HmoA